MPSPKTVSKITPEWIQRLADGCKGADDEGFMATGRPPGKKQSNPYTLDLLLLAIGLLCGGYFVFQESAHAIWAIIAAIACVIGFVRNYGHRNIK